MVKKYTLEPRPTIATQLETNAHKMQGNKSLYLNVIKIRDKIHAKELSTPALNTSAQPTI